jgi:hypothetical protein
MCLPLLLCEVAMKHHDNTVPLKTMNSQQDADEDAVMTEAEWLACTDPKLMLEFLNGKGSDRKLRLFACACCRRVWHLLTDTRNRTAVEMAEVFADGGMTDEMLVTFHKEAYPIYENLRGDEMSAARGAAFSAWCFVEESLPSAFFATNNCLRELSEISGQTFVWLALLQDVFRNPFRPVTINPEWLTWNDGTVRRIAQSIYEEKAYDRMPILADALTDAGCDNADILNHCRSDRPHVRGCWVVDLALGKE